MTSFKLFREYSSKTIWGDTLADALTREGKLNSEPKIGRIDSLRGTNVHIVPQAPLVIRAILGYADVANSTRGNTSFIRAIVELEDNRIVEVDAAETGSLLS
jgi:hypothetical protein